MNSVDELALPSNVDAERASLAESCSITLSFSNTWRANVQLSGRLFVQCKVRDWRPVNTRAFSVPIRFSLPKARSRSALAEITGRHSEAGS